MDTQQQHELPAADTLRHYCGICGRSVSQTRVPEVRAGHWRHTCHCKYDVRRHAIVRRRRGWDGTRADWRELTA